MKTTKRLTVSALSLLLSPPLLAIDFSLENANRDKVAVENWECKQCKPAEGTSGHFEVGAVNADIEDIHSANTLGTDRDGLSLRAGADISHWSSNDIRWLFNASDLGLDVAEAHASGGRAGDFSARLGYRGLAKWDATVLSPFLINDNRFTLGNDWVNGATTSAMTGLDDALSPVDLKIKRDLLSLNLDKYFNNIRTYAGIEQTQRRGRKRASSSLITNSVALPLRVEDRTTDFVVGLDVAGGPWQLDFGYLGSRYRNDVDSLYWQNPYTATFGSATAALQSVAPDNDADQFHLRGSWARGIHVVSGQIVYGRHKQDAALLPATINGPSPELPGSSADLKVDRIDADLRYRLKVGRKGALQLQYGYQDRDYDSPNWFYPQINTDSVPAADRLPYYPSHERQDLEAKFNYRFTSGFSGELGYRYRTEDWENQRVDSADTHRYWGKLRFKRWQKLQIWLELAGENREADNYLDPVDANGTSNPALRQYHLADRDRAEGKIVFQYRPLEALTLALTLEGMEEDYDDQIGLDEVTRSGYNFDVGWFQEDYNLYFFYNDYRTKTRLDGSNFSSTWRALQDDEAQSIGIGGEYTGLFDALSVGLDAVYADSDGLTQLEQGLTGRYGDVSASRTTVDIYARYQLSEQSSVQLDLLMQKYDDSDYLYHGLEADSIGNVLFFPDFSHDYSDYRIGVSYRHDF
ncbi:MtrB/PioB family decaheme-associated outer membrane protein [Ferrimonas marina]|uniref:Decaheme-associated outer membrane protein, MtrB/PioB family n=1 Tax=Ferrimonas marina TaxID=299255 RepID=A0A1M5YTY0_9GAMM|nr:MtrB/PioB family decaheme-associated outer membrane protein [Ferrimonas marina]SHI15547.1 decaheme-associated outer membrane protein, MtrB/PioB family [Ferrimonas marina]